MSSCVASKKYVQQITRETYKIIQHRYYNLLSGTLIYKNTKI